jgi:hypothetical protein
VAAFLREHGVEFEGEFATVQGYVIVDLGMRMLTPRELFRAQGFGNEYVIDRAWVVDPETGGIEEITLTKEQQIRMCGNSVCPPVMEAIVRGNVSEMRLSAQLRVERTPSAVVESSGGDAAAPGRMDGVEGDGDPGLKPGATSLLPLRGAGRALARSAAEPQDGKDNAQRSTLNAQLPL